MVEGPPTSNVAPMTPAIRICSILTAGLAIAQAESAPPAVGTQVTVGRSSGLAIQVRVDGPATQRTPLQVACVFEYVEGDITTSPPALPPALNGMGHLDASLHGLITEIRRNGRFSGHALETLLLTPPQGTLGADRLLLIGLGDRRSFRPALMEQVGAVGMREALRLGVTAYSHASDVKDAGVNSPTGPTAVALVRGALEALTTEQYLASKGMSPKPTVETLTVLAGRRFFQESADAIRHSLSEREAIGPPIRWDNSPRDHRQ